jgi:hypothetical protein
MIFSINKVSKEGSVLILDCENQKDVRVPAYVNSVKVKGKIKFVNQQDTLCLDVARLPISNIDLSDFVSLKYLDVGQIKSLKQVDVFKKDVRVSCDKSLDLRFYDKVISDETLLKQM